MLKVVLVISDCDCCHRGGSYCYCVVGVAGVVAVFDVAIGIVIKKIAVIEYVTAIALMVTGFWFTSSSKTPG